ncbi:MAG: type IV pilus modification protein PilV [Comamonadaceae bacterium]|nr:MAG: type IV pilus modification protein PilV [Comamonadaceae bacterium]
MPSRRPQPQPSQRGFTIIEVLVSLLIFSVGLLGVVSLFGAAVRTSTSAEFRTMAAMMASDLIGRMWMSDRTYTTLQATYSSTNQGGGYVAWKNMVTSSGLPEAASLAPTVTFTTVGGGGGATAVNSSQATITIFWKAPGDGDVHQYVAVAQMKP